MQNVRTLYLLNDRLADAVDTDPVKLPPFAGNPLVIFLAHRVSVSGSIACQMQVQMDDESWLDLDEGYFAWPGDTPNTGQRSLNPVHITTAEDGSIEHRVSLPNRNIRAHITTSATGKVFDAVCLILLRPAYADTPLQPTGQTQTTVPA